VSLDPRLGDPNLKMIAEWSVGAAMFHLGQLEPAHEHLARGLELHDPSFHGPRVWQTGIEPGIFCRCEFSRTLVLRGFPDSGLAAAREAVAQARALDHPQPLAFAMLFEIIVRLSRREPQEALTMFDQLATLCRAHGIAQELLWAAPLRGRALIELGETDAGFRELEEGIAVHRTTRSALLRPYYLVLLAGGLVRLRRYEDALRALEEAASVAAAPSSRHTNRSVPVSRARSCPGYPAAMPRRSSRSACRFRSHARKARAGWSSGAHAPTRTSWSIAAVPPRPAIC
jgi:tetratricopeptide (TPR) repeat protein